MVNFSKLKDMREDHDLSQKQLAQILGIERSAYSLWELGINIIPLQSISNLADYYHVSIDYLLGLTKEKKECKKGLDWKQLGENIKKNRQAQLLSQESLGNLIGVSQACISKYEKGNTKISLPNLYDLSKIFQTSITKLCGKEK